MRRMLIGVALAATPATAVAAEPGVEFENTGKDCRNLAIMMPIDPVAARELVPERFAFTERPEGFVELATCPSGTIDGVERPAYRIAEAAVVIRKPAPFEDPGGTITQDIYAISQLDTDPMLSAKKVDVGFRSELVDIAFDRSGLNGSHIEAKVPWAFSPYTMSADISPVAPPIPVATIVTRIWGLGPKGLVLTRNDIQRIDEGSVAAGTVTFAEGSPLARLFGGTRISGTGIAGRGTFTNVTRIIEPAPVAPPAPAPTPAGPTVTARISTATRKETLLVSVTGIGRARLVATVRRGRTARGGLVRTLRGRSPLRWGGRRTDGRRVRDGIYTVRVRRTSGRRAIGSVTVRVSGRRVRLVD